MPYIENSEATVAYAPQLVAAEDAPSWQADEIAPRLFMGGTADEDTVDKSRDLNEGAATDEYDAVATLYAWARPAGSGTQELRYGFMDGDLDLETVREVVNAAIWVHEHWTAGEKVLVRCQAGLNRSGLVVALVLMFDGLPAEEAINLLRERRSRWALCNEAFVRWLIEEADVKLRSSTGDE